MPKPSAPSGFRDFLPEQYRRRTELVARIRRVYESFGFQGMDTPATENLSVFLGKGGGENEKLMFQVLKRGAELKRAIEGGGELADMGLRFDLTVPLARYFATHRAELPAVFKRYQIGPVWRAERPQHGRFREFWQCDIDVLGSSSPLVEAEVILATSTALADIGFRDLTVRMNSRPLLDALVRAFGVAEAHLNLAFVAIDKLDKVSPEEVEKELVEKGVSPEAVKALLDFRARSAALDDPLGAVEQIVGPAQRPLVEQLRAVSAIVPKLSAGRLLFDPFLARGMDYYTGPVFEIAAAGVPFSLGGGGRFDGLIERLGGPSVPGCGFSIGFERVCMLVEERNMFGGSARAADVLVAVPSIEAGAFALELGAELRAQGLSVDVFPGTPKLGAQYELAERKGIPFAILADPAAERLTVRDLRTRQNSTLARAELIGFVRQNTGP